jgi:hypothetical protein
MPSLNRLVRHGRLAALVATTYPTLQDAVAEALTNVFTEKVSIPGSGWLAIPLSLMASAALEKLTGLVNGSDRAGSRGSGVDGRRPGRDVG